MKNILLTMIVLLLGSLPLSAQILDHKYDLPELHAIKTVILSPSYSCRDSFEFQKGYVNTALFLSDFSRRQNSPDLLFNGACGSDDYFDSSTAGDDMSLIADLGAGVDLGEISASRAFNLKRVHSFDAYSKFVRTAEVIEGHTYAVLLNKGKIRGLMIFTVVDHSPNRSVSLKYAVKSYEILEGKKVSSPGFDWNQKSS